MSALIAEAQRSGPQAITRHGQPVAVVMAPDEYARLAARPEGSLFAFLASAPLAALQLDDRDAADVGREVEL